MTKKTLPQFTKVSPLTPRFGTEAYTVVGNRVLAVPAKSAKAIKQAGVQAMRSLRTKEAA